MNSIGYIIYMFFALFFLYLYIIRFKLRLSLFTIFWATHFILFGFTPLLFKQYYLIHDNYYQLMVLISFCTIPLAYMIPYFRYHEEHLVYKSNGLETYIFYVDLIVMLFSISFLISQFDFDTNRISNSLSESQGIQSKGFINIIMLIIKFGSFMHLSKLMKDKKWGLSTLYISVSVIYIILTSVHRTPIFIAIITPVIFIFIYFQNGRLKPKQFIILFITSLIIMAVGSWYRIGKIKEVKIDYEHTVENNFKGLNTSRYFYELYSNDYPIEWGENIHYYLLGFIPRKVWKEKPIVSFNVRITEKYFNYTIGDNWDSVIHTYTVPGEGWVHFGIFGVFLFSFLSVLIYRSWLLIFSKYQNVELIIIPIILRIFINYRGAFDSIFYDFVLSLIILVLARFLYFKKTKISVKNGFYQNLDNLRFKIY